MNPGLEETQHTLANAVELGSRVALRVAGNAVSNQLSGKPVDQTTLSQLIAAKVQSCLQKKMGVV